MKVQFDLTINLTMRPSFRDMDFINEDHHTKTFSETYITGKFSIYVVHQF